MPASDGGHIFYLSLEFFLKIGCVLASQFQISEGSFAE